MNRCVVSVFGVSALAVVFPAALAAETFYVAPPPAGDDGNSGSSGSPWATLQHAADTVQAGDTVLVRAGSFAGAQLTTSGTSGLPITFAAAPGEQPMIVADNAFTPDGLNLEGASFNIIDGFTVDGRTRAGIRAVLCESVTIRNNRCDTNGRWGIFTGFCDDLVIEGNHTSNSIIEHGIYVSNSGDRPVIRGNRIWGNNANGIHMNGDISQGGDGVISDAVVEENVIFDNGVAGGSGINLDGVQTSIVRNNLIFDTHASGISLYRIDGGAPSNGNKVFNNTVIVAKDGRWGLNIQDGSSGNIVRNNVFYSEHEFRGAMSVCMGCSLSSDNNAVEDRFTRDGGNSVINLAQWQTQTGQDFNSFTTMPEDLFANYDGNDYHLSAGSAAIDSGEMLTADVPTDLEGRIRPIGPSWDIGAYEGGGAIFADGFESGDTSRWDGS